MELQKIRDQFPALNQKINGNDLIYFDSAASSLKPDSVIKAISDYYSTINSNVHRSSHYLSSMSTLVYENARTKVAGFINANPDEVIFTAGTTDSLNFLAAGLSKSLLNEGDEIILTVSEHHSNIVPWVALKKEKNINIKVLDVDENGILKIEQFEDLISDRTKILSIAHSSNVLGTIHPVKQIIEIAKNKGIISIVDGAQTVAHSKVDVEDIGCDFYCFSAHKMFGPMGLGILFGRSEILKNLPPFRYGGGMIKNVDFDNVEFTTLPSVMEAGTPYVSGAVGLDKAIDFLNEVGFDNIIKHEDFLTKYATLKLESIEGMQILGKSQLKDPIISFNVEGIHHADLSMILDNFGIAIRSGQHCTQPLMDRFGLKGTLRISFSVFNTVEEIDFFIEKLKIAISMLK